MHDSDRHFSLKVEIEWSLSDKNRCDLFHFCCVKQDFVRFFKCFFL